MTASKTYENVVIGLPLVPADQLLANSLKDWNNNEFKKTLVTNNTWLPKILVDCGIVSSTSEVKRNRKDLWIDLKDHGPDFLTIKWGKKFLFIVIGEPFGT